MKVYSSVSSRFRITKNKSVMDYAKEYAKEENLGIETLKSINHVRLYKGVFLPCELLGQSRKEQTVAFRDKLRKSQIK